jgi:hypothetical protein
MFWEPEFSGSTTTYIVTNGLAGSYDHNAAFRNPNVSFATDGNQALEVLWKWVNQNDPDAWVRLTTNNHPVRPNPALDIRGKVRFDITNYGDFSGGEVGLVLGIRETGQNVPQLANGGATGTIEWVGVKETVNAILAGVNGVSNTTASGDDIQVIEVGSTGLTPDTVTILPGPNNIVNSTPASDDVARYGYRTATAGGRVPVPAVTLPVFFFPYFVEFNLLNGDVTVDDGNGGVIYQGGIVGFTGDNALSAPDFRGALDHIAFTNVTTDPPTSVSPGVPDVYFGVDALQVEATVIDPLLPPSIQGPVFAGATQVVVNCAATANLAKLYIDGSSNGIAPVAPTANVATFNGLSLVAGQVLTAKQRRGTEWSDFSVPVEVTPAGQLLIEDFDAYLTRADLLTTWGDSITTGATGQLKLESGAAASCPNFVTEANDATTGTTGSRLYRYIGNVNGTDAEPMWVTWYFRQDIDNGNARTRFELARFASGEWSAGTTNEGSVGFALSNGIAALSTQYAVAMRSTAAATADSNGFALDYTGYQMAATGVTRTAGVWHKMQIEVRSTTLNFYIDDNSANPAAFPTGVPRSNTDPYQFIILGIGFGNNGPRMMWDNVAVTKGNAQLPFDAVPPPPPTLAAAILPNATSVTVSDVNTNATEVAVYQNGALKGSVTTTGFSTTTVVVPTTAMTSGQSATARQIIDGEESCDSPPKIVGAPPGAPVVSRPLEAGQGIVTVTGVDPTATQVFVYANTDGLIGQVNPNGLTTANVPVSPLVHLDRISATAGNAAGQGAQSVAHEVGRGNGDIYISLGVRETTTTGPVGTNGLASGGIEWIGATGTVSGAPIGKPISPSNSWQTITFNPATDPILAFAGAANGAINGQWGALEHIAFTVNPTSGRSIGKYRIYIDNIVNVIGGTPTPVGNFDNYADNQSDVMFRTPGFSGSTSANLYTPAGNISRITSAQGNPNKSVEVQYYLVDSGASRWVRLTTNAAPTLPNPAIRIDQPVRMDILLIENVPPAAPTVNSPLEDGNTSVRVSDVLPEATSVNVYANGVQIGTAPVTTTNGIVDVSVAANPLIYMNSITAKQITPSGLSSPSAALEVGKGSGDVLLSLLIRESGDAGPIGSQGTDTGEMEFIGADTNGVGGAPLGIAISPTNGWQQVTFNPAVLSPFGSLGNGAITATRGVINSLAVTVNSASAGRSSGSYRMYIDNVVNVGAATITGFEGYTTGDEVLFQEPTFSGSTSANLSSPPSSSSNSDVYNNGGTRSQLLTWFFRDTTAGRWARIASANVANLNYPIIDLTKPVTMDVLLLEGCPTILGDMNGNCSRTVAADWQAFSACLGGPTTSAGPACICADFNGDGRVDLRDYAALQRAWLDPVANCP